MRENQPDTDQRLESKRYNRELVNTRNSFMFLFLFEIIIIIVIGWAVIDGYDTLTPLYVFIILICLSIIVLCINALFTIVEIWKKYKKRI